MLVGLTPDEVIAARRGPITEGKFGDPDARTMDVPAYGARGTANEPTKLMPTDDVGDYGKRSGPAPTPKATADEPPAPLAARVRASLGVGQRVGGSRRPPLP